MFALLLTGLALTACRSEEAGAGSESAVSPAPAVEAVEAGSPASPSLGDGYLVWESNRSGAWRLWTRDLAGSEPRQLTADEDGRRHCCPHISPDGRWIAYLSLPAGKQEYSDGVTAGPLRLIRPEGSEERTLADLARTYFEHRAAVWRSPTELIYIGPEGRTQLFDLAAEPGADPVRQLTRQPAPEYGSLVDATLSWATSGRVDFAAFQADSGRLVPHSAHNGCQPYFSHDGQWGFWTAGVGGPINRIDLATGEVTPILHKNDPLLPAGMGYLYFPMLSRDGRLLAFAASRDEHDHFRSDYDIFVAETDPRTLEVLAPPLRMTDHPSTDRFPDAFLRPLELGRHAGEAPMTVEFVEPGQGEWRWSFGDGGEPRVAAGGVSRTFETAGRWQVTAEQAGSEPRTLRGLVVTSAAAPPRPLRVDLVENGRRLEVPFDEPLGERPPVARLEPPVGIEGWSLSPDGRRLRLELEEPLIGAATLHLSGLVDRAERPNPMTAAQLPVEPPFWPSNRDGLAFVWATANAPNQLFDSRLGAERLNSVQASGRAVFDHHFAMRLGRGVFVASAEDQQLVLDAVRASNRFSLEAFVVPGAAGRIISMGSKQLNFALRAEAGALHFTLRTGSRGPQAYQDVRIARSRPGQAAHVVVTYEPGRLAAFADGESAGEWPVTGDFFHWRRYPLLFGHAVTAGEGVAPSVEGVAIYDRPLGQAEARENFLRYGKLRAERPEVPRTVVEARLLSATPAPTLAEISPYREALLVWEWEVTRVLEGRHPGGVTRVAHWALLDGKPEAILELRAGASRRLTLEAFESNPQLEGVFLADSLPPGPRLFHDVE